MPLYPKIYLERYILELFTKTYIFSNIAKQKVISSGKKAFVITVDSIGRRIKMHSLIELMELLLLINYKLITDFDDRDSIMKEAQKWSKFDLEMTGTNIQ